MFRQLVNVVSRKASAAKLPSVGLRLNASKPESMLENLVMLLFQMLSRVDVAALSGVAKIITLLTQVQISEETNPL